MTDDDLKTAIAVARAQAKSVGPQHSYWELIADAEAYLQGRPGHAILSRSEIDRLMAPMLVIGSVSRAVAAADPEQRGQIDDSEMGDYFWQKYRDHYVPMGVAALTGLRDHLVTLRGDPRAYGQGFNDPYGALISQLNEILKGPAS